MGLALSEWRQLLWLKVGWNFFFLPERSEMWTHLALYLRPWRYFSLREKLEGVVGFTNNHVLWLLLMNKLVSWTLTAGNFQEAHGKRELKDYFAQLWSTVIDLDLCPCFILPSSLQPVSMLAPWVPLLVAPSVLPCTSAPLEVVSWHWSLRLFLGLLICNYNEVIWLNII